MKLCPKCMEENDDAAASCRRCRAPFESAAKTSCPRGHLIDPTWTECPYCRAEQSSPGLANAVEAGGRPKTVVERPKTMDEQSYGMGMGGYSAPPPPPPPSLGGRPQPPNVPSYAPAPPQAPQPPQTPQAPQAREPEPALAGRRKTVFMPPPAAGEEPQAAESANPVQPPRRAAERRVVGVLVTYSWRPEGQVFAVREGRNLIGRGSECEISVPEDNTLSNVNSHITYRKNFVIGDMISMSGTDVNGRPIEEQFVPLPNYSTIRTGSTHWTFVSIQQAPAAGSDTPSE